MRVRYMQPEQILGITFQKLLETDQNKISWAKFNQLSKCVEQSLWEKNKTYLNATSNEIYAVVEQYREIFLAQKQYIRLNDKIGKNENEDEKREKIMSNLKKYFLDSIPSDISKTAEDVLEKEMETVK